MKERTQLLVPFLFLFAIAIAFGAESPSGKDKFRQLEEILPSPNVYRTASGAPGRTARSSSAV